MILFLNFSNMIFADAFTSCIHRFGRLDIVVNNTAGMQIDLSIDERDEMNDAIMRVHYVSMNKHNPTESY